MGPSSSAPYPSMAAAPPLTPLVSPMSRVVVVRAPRTSVERAAAARMAARAAAAAYATELAAHGICPCGGVQHPEATPSGTVVLWCPRCLAEEPVVRHHAAARPA